MSRRNNSLRPKSKIRFPSTYWADIDRWRTESSEVRQEVLRKFFIRYRMPLINFIISKNNDSDTAEDLFQDFLSHIMESDLLGKVDRSRGKFRTLLLF